MIDDVAFTIHGKAVTQGSMSLKYAKGFRHPKLKHSVDTLAWRNRVSWAASLAMRGRPLLIDPVECFLLVVLPRPKSLAKRVLYPSTRPDLDKLERLIGDAMKNVVLQDDGLIVHWHSWKLYGSPPREQVLVRLARPLADAMQDAHQTFGAYRGVGNAEDGEL